MIVEGFCAICTAGTATDGVTLRLVEIDGVKLRICSRCDSEHPRDGGYGFDGGKPADVRAERSYGEIVAGLKRTARGKS